MRANIDDDQVVEKDSHIDRCHAFLSYESRMTRRDICWSEIGLLLKGGYPKDLTADGRHIYIERGTKIDAGSSFR